ncbi:uncharacterized protein LOC141854192 [Brevipalpus obovatus]|uniref:uncharacterized protein LOC141854192 n=1 Tax=Brevipalpus obovatus TaxID=246614 RepID=UPI003D9DDFE3
MGTIVLEGSPTSKYPYLHKCELVFFQCSRESLVRERLESMVEQGLAICSSSLVHSSRRRMRGPTSVIELEAHCLLIVEYILRSGFTISTASRRGDSVRFVLHEYESFQVR